METTELDEMRILGVYGICKEAYTITKLHVRLFLSLGLTLVLPLGAIIFSHSLLSDLSVHKHEIETETVGSPTAAYTKSVLVYIINSIYFIFVLVFSHLSTAPIVYTVASIYTSKGLSYKISLIVLPKVWKRLFMTFLWVKFLFLVTSVLSMLLTMLLLLQPWTSISITVFVITSFSSWVYISMVSNLASVVTVLEDSYGISAIKKSADLIKGKRWVGILILLLDAVATGMMLRMFHDLVWSPEFREESIFGKVVVGVALLGLWAVVTMVGIVVQTIMYFVCKSVHSENIDRGLLSEHLDGYLGEYMPLTEGPTLSLDALEGAEQRSQNWQDFA